MEPLYVLVTGVLYCTYNYAVALPLPHPPFRHPLKRDPSVNLKITKTTQRQIYAFNPVETFEGRFGLT